MKLLIGIGAAVIIAVALFCVIRSFIVVPASVTIGNIPSIVEQLKEEGKNGSWAVLVFTPNGAQTNQDNSINLQYSIEDGHMGLDWVLLGPRNIADKDKIMAFATERRHVVTERELNGVRYLRIEDDLISQLGAEIITEFYHIDQHGKVSLITDGFDWQSGGSKK